MRKILIKRVDTGEPVVIEYDETAPCLIASAPPFPVIHSPIIVKVV